MLGSFILKTALVAILGFGPTNALSGAKVSRDDTNWITVWGSMPQLTEPGNLPPAPFVSSTVTIVITRLPLIQVH